MPCTAGHTGIDKNKNTDIGAMNSSVYLPATFTTLFVLAAARLLGLA